MKGLFCLKRRFFPLEIATHDKNTLNAQHSCPPANFLKPQPIARHHVEQCGPNKLGTSVRPPGVIRAKTLEG